MPLEDFIDEETCYSIINSSKDFISFVGKEIKIKLSEKAVIPLYQGIILELEKNFNNNIIITYLDDKGDKGKFCLVKNNVNPPFYFQIV